MCGRFVQADQGAIERAWSIKPRDKIPLLSAKARYNVTPGSYIAVTRCEAEGHPTLRAARWGLVPPWAGTSETGQSMINARAETAASKPAFRSAVAKRRCLVPVVGWYEWQRLGGSGNKKQPWFIYLPDGNPMAMAAIWEQKPINAVDVLETVSILTREAAASISHIHQRMPIVLNADQQSAWLQAGKGGAEVQTELALNGAVLDFKAHRVSPRVNRPANDDPELCAPAQAEADPQADLWDNSGS